MLAVACPNCKVRYRVPDTARGKRITCKKCGKPFRIGGAAAAAEARSSPAASGAGDSQIGLSDLEALAGGEAVKSRPAALASHPPMTAAAATSHPVAGGASILAPPGYADERAEGGAGAYLRYVKAFGKSFLFVRSADSLLTFGVVWFLLALRELMITAFMLLPCLFFITCLMGIIAISGWYMAFKMNVVVWAAGDERTLPPPVADDGWWDGVFVPFFRMLATYVLALLPAFFFIVVLAGRVAAKGATMNAPPTGTPTPGGSAVAVFALLFLAGGFLWPMMVLIVSIGGSVRALFRLDLIFETVLRSFPAYVLTVLAVYAALAVRGLVSRVVGSAIDANATFQDDWGALVVLPALFVGITAYFDIVAMQAIGYYYRDFKDKFAWSWG